jgi:tryptophanyl-tRNA synthetase
METVVSGIRPTGHLHLGNYFGALKNFVRMQKDFNAFFFIADIHSLTTHPTPENLHRNIKTVLAEYLALGLDPNNCTLYIQSDIPEIPELYTYMNMMAYIGELSKSPSFKDKLRAQPDNQNAGLLTYPVLMAVDILIMKAGKVPVGKDQQQHLEMTRTLAKRFNHFYKTDYFPEPEAFNYGDELIKIPGLTGQGKMSKSGGDNDAIFFVDEPNKLKKKIMRAKSDSGPTEPNSRMPEEISNLFSLMELVSSTEVVEEFRTAYADCTIRYGDMKKQLAADMEAFVSPKREAIEEMMGKHDYLNEVAQEGAEKARIHASETVKDVREIIGFKRFY